MTATGCALLLCSGAVAWNRWQRVSGWPRAVATFEFKAKVSSEEHASVRYSFSFTDPHRGRRWFGAVPFFGPDLRVGDLVPVAYSPTSNDVEVLQIRFLLRPALRLAWAGTILVLPHIAFLLTTASA